MDVIKYYPQSRKINASIPTNAKLVSVYFPDVAERCYLDNRKLCRPKFKLLTCASFVDYAVLK